MNTGTLNALAILEPPVVANFARSTEKSSQRLTMKLGGLSFFEPLWILTTAPFEADRLPDIVTRALSGYLICRPGRNFRIGTEALDARTERLELA